MPTFTASAPASISACVPSAVATLPAMMRTELESFLARVTASSTRCEWPCAVSTTSRSTPPSISRSARSKPSSPTLVAAATRKPPLRVLGRVRVELRLLDVLDGDQADAIAGGIDDQQLLDAVLVQQALGFVLVDVLLHGDQVVARHQLIDVLRRIGGEAHVAVGQDADQPAGLLAAGAAVLDHRNAGNAMRPHQRAGIGQRRFGTDGHRVDDHAGFEFLDLADLLGLLGRREIAVDDADAAGLRHGDGQPRFGHRIHRRRQDRRVQLDVAGDPRARCRSRPASLRNGRAAAARRRR